MNMLARNFPHLLKSRQARNKTSDIPRTTIQTTAPNSGEFSWNQCVFFGNTSVLSGSFNAAISLFLLVRKHGWEFYSSKIDLNLSAKFLSSLFNCLIQQPRPALQIFMFLFPSTITWLVPLHPKAARLHVTLYTRHEMRQLSYCPGLPPKSVHFIAPISFTSPHKLTSHALSIVF